MEYQEVSNSLCNPENFPAASVGKLVNKECECSSTSISGCDMTISCDAANIDWFMAFDRYLLNCDSKWETSAAESSVCEYKRYIKNWRLLIPITVITHSIKGCPQNQTYFRGVRRGVAWGRLPPPSFSRFLPTFLEI